MTYRTEQDKINRKEANQRYYKLEEERNELLMDNKRLAAQVEDQIDQLRKSGVL